MKNYYFILGVNENATKIEIRSAYRKLSKKFHPDLNGGDLFFESKFKEINEAYEVLSNDVKRSKYDTNRKSEYFKGQEQQSSKPIIKEFFISKNQAIVGEEIELKWHVENCEDVKINLFGKVSSIGSKKIIFKKPKNNLQIKITCFSSVDGMIIKDINIDIFEKVKNHRTKIIKSDNFLVQNKYILLLLLLFSMFLLHRFYKSDNLKYSYINLITRDDSLDTTNFVLNGVNPYINIVINEQMLYLNSSYYISQQIPLWKYLTDLIPHETNSKPIAKFIIADNQKEYLIVMSYTGGAHCCIEYNAFKYDTYNKAYINTGNYTFDANECSNFDDLEYPIVVNSRYNYFYTSYYSSFIYGCSEEFYKENLVILNDSLKMVIKGNAFELEQCIISFFKNNKIPELKNYSDYGERSTILNLFDDFYQLTKNLDKIFFIYNTYMPDVNDRTHLWFEILERILPPENLKDKVIMESILEYNYCIDKHTTFTNYNETRVRNLVAHTLGIKKMHELNKVMGELTRKYNNNWNQFIIDNNINRNGYLDKLEMIADKLIFNLPLNKVDGEYINKMFTNNLDLNLPEGFYIPSFCEISPGSGWEFVKFNYQIKEPYHITGDFNGDNLLDHAYLLHDGNIHTYALFCFFNSENDGYKIYELPFSTKNGTHPITDIILYEAKRNEFACLYDEYGENIIDKIKLNNSAIVVSGYEFGDPLIFVYNDETKTFDEYWGCVEN